MKRSSEGARERLIPILMTALSSGLALIPLAPRRRAGRQRDSDADGNRDSLRLDDLDALEHGSGPDDVFAVRTPVRTDAKRERVRWLPPTIR